MNFNADGMQSQGNTVGNPGTGMAGVLADDDARLGGRGEQIVAERASDEKHAFAGEREISRDATDTVGAEELAGGHLGWVCDGEFSRSIVTVTWTERGLETWMRGSET